MIEALPYLPSLILAVLVWRVLRDRDKQVNDVLRASELARREQAEQAAEDRASLIENHEKQTSELLTRIQAPEAAPFVLGADPGKQHLDAENDDAYWEHMIEQAERGNGDE